MRPSQFVIGSLLTFGSPVVLAQAQAPDFLQVLVKVREAGAKVKRTAPGPRADEIYRAQVLDAIATAANEALLRHRRHLRSGDGPFFRGELQVLAREFAAAYSSYREHLRTGQASAYYHDALLAAASLAFNYGDGQEQAARFFGIVDPESLRLPQSASRHRDVAAKVRDFRARALLHGALPPALPVEHVIGGAGDLSLSRFAGRVVVLGFWASWVPPCRDSIRAMITVQQRHQGALQVLAVGYPSGRGLDLSVEGSRASRAPLRSGLEPARERELLRAFHGAMGMEFPWLETHEAVVRRQWHVGEMPCVFVIDRDGRVRGHVLGHGPRNLERIERLIQQALQR